MIVKKYSLVQVHTKLYCVIFQLSLALVDKLLQLQYSLVQVHTKLYCVIFQLSLALADKLLQPQYSLLRFPLVLQLAELLQSIMQTNTCKIRFDSIRQTILKLFRSVHSNPLHQITTRQVVPLYPPPILRP